MAKKETNSQGTTAKVTAKAEAKPAKAAKTSGGGGSAVKAKVAAIVRTDHFKIFGIIGLSLLLVLCLSLGLVFGLKNCAGMDGILAQDPVKVNKYAQTTVVGYSSKVVDTVQRYKPVEEIQNESEAFPIVGATTPAKRYPTYGSTPSGYTGETNAPVRQAIVSESAYLCAWGTRGANRGGAQTADKYTRIDKDGWLYQYKNGEWIHSLKKGTEEYVESNYRQLYKHSASVGLYLGNVSDSEPGIVKQVNLRPRGYSSYSVTGVYAPAGEVIKIQLSGADMNATGGITIHIGQALYNGQANNIWVGKNTMPRMAHVLTTLVINKSTATYDEATDTWTGYVGSFLGGPLYIRNTSANAKVTISGGVAYRHFILGYTSPEEYAELCKSTAPYFDLEVWDKGVLHSGPVRYASSFSYDQLYKAAVLWEKVSLVSTQNGSKQGIVFIYDPFVAAGAAVAFPGRSSVNCPLGWMSQSLNYNKIVTSGSWGNFHEYNHNFQNYGMGYTGEVTNNGLNLVAYSLFTNISSARQIGGYGGAGLSGWNRYTSATWALNQVNAGSIKSTNGLAVYSTLLHNLGQDAYIKSRGANGVNNYLNKWATVTHQDMSYYGELTNPYHGATYTPSAAVTNANYPLFVPVSSVYQTGRTYMYDGEKREITTMQPYVIPAEKSFTVDLNPYTTEGGQYRSGSVIIGKNFTYKIKSVNTDGINGTFVKSGTDGVYTFTPNNELRSGKIRVTLEITATDSKWESYKIDDVDLILEFQQSREWNKSILERTIYTYSADKMPTDAQAAFESNFAGYSSTTGVFDHSNPTQNANTDIWFWPESNRATNPNAPDHYFVSDNQINVIDGKLYFTEDGKYRVYLRGRLNCAVYFSLDGVNYTAGAAIKDKTVPANSAEFRLNDSNTYFDIEFDDGEVTVWTYAGGNKTYKFTVQGDYWLYTKEVLIVQSTPARSYIGLGTAQWITPAYSADVKYYIDGTNTELTWNEDEEIYTYTSGGVKYYVESDGTRYHYVDIEKVTDSSVTIMTQTIYTNLTTGETNIDESKVSDDPIPPTGTPAYATAYRRSYDFKKEFVSDYFYTRTYNYNLVGRPQIYSTWDDGVSIVSFNKNPWNDTMGIDNLLQEGTDTFFHSDNNSNYSKGAMVLELDMGKQITANSITFLGRVDGTKYAASTAWQGLPNKFSLEVSMDGTNYTSAGNYENSGIRNNTQVTVALNGIYEFRYVKITINSTWSNNKHFVYSGIYFSYTFTLTGNGRNFYSPDNAMFTYKGNWEVKSCTSNFGHVYVGNNGTVEFEFEGTRFAILASELYGRNYVVTVDGKEYGSADLTYLQSVVGYLTPKLSEGKHKVVIYCPDGGNIDSIVLY